MVYSLILCYNVVIVPYYFKVYQALEMQDAKELPAMSRLEI